MRSALRALEHEIRQSGSILEPRTNIFKVISLEIESETGVLIPHERLRQFAKGFPVPHSKVERRYPMRLRNPEHMSALANFVVSEKNTHRSLFQSLNMNGSSDIQILVELFSKHLRAPDTNTGHEATTLEGTYSSRTETNQQTRQFDLIIDSGSSEDIFDIVLVQQCFRVDKDGILIPSAFERWVGWGIIDSENKFVAFLKSEIDSTAMFVEIIWYEYTALPANPSQLKVSIHSNPLYVDRESWTNTDVFQQYMDNTVFDFFLENNE